jgi:prophage regulatory protein
MANAVIRFPELQKIVGLSRTSIWRLERQRKFPAHLNLSSRAVAWRRREVEQWLRERTSAHLRAAVARVI